MGVIPLRVAFGLAGLIGVAALPGAPLFAATLTSAQECQDSIRDDPEQAREDAAQWAALGGGAEARLCEAAALAALGAHETAAARLTELAQDHKVNLGAELRAQILEDAGGQWLLAAMPENAAAVLDAALMLVQPGPERLLKAADAHEAAGQRENARQLLALVLSDAPDNAEARVMAARFSLFDSKPDAALRFSETALKLQPLNPDALFLKAEALAGLGRREAAAAAWLDLIAQHPGTQIAARAQAAVQGLAD